MKYAYNDVGGLINGVIVYFETGDDEIKKYTFDFLAGQKESPTSIVQLENQTVAIRFTFEREEKLLRDYLYGLAAAYPPLEKLMREIHDTILPQVPRSLLS